MIWILWCASHHRKEVHLPTISPYLSNKYIISLYEEKIGQLVDMLDWSYHMLLCNFSSKSTYLVLKPPQKFFHAFCICCFPLSLHCELAQRNHVLCTLLAPIGRSAKQVCLKVSPILSRGAFSRKVLQPWALIKPHFSPFGIFCLICKSSSSGLLATTFEEAFFRIIGAYWGCLEVCMCIIMEKNCSLRSSL